MATNVQSVRSRVFSETWLSVRFELLKHLKRRRLLILVALAILLPLFPLIRTPDTAAQFAANSLSFMTVLIIVSAAMFAGDAVCGEFEKKTSLLLFPTPQSRASIFAGKYVAALLCTFLVVSLWYLVLTLETGVLYGWGEMPADLWKSFATALIFSTAAVSVAFFISSVLNRSISATIFVFLILMMIMPLGVMIMTLLDWEPWFIVTYSANLITTVLGVSSRLPMGPHGGDVVQQFTPTFGRGVAVMAIYAVVGLAAGMGIAVRKED
jgi:ABC-type transport system involved in multi-copper enzyme maturation permease subunit